MSKRYSYGELKESGTVTIAVKVKPEVRDDLNLLRGERSWPRFMEEIALMLKTRASS